MSYTFVTEKGKKYVAYWAIDVSRNKWVKQYDVEHPFVLMPEYTKEEKARITNRNNDLIEAELSASWKAEKARQDAIKAEWRKQPKKVRDASKPVFEITNSEDWDKAHRQAIRERVEAMSPPISVSDRKCPMENPIFADVVFQAHKAGVPEEVTDLFVQRIRTLGNTSPEAAQVVFEHFAANPKRIEKFGCYSPGRIASPISIPEELVDLFHERLHFPRNTGKGELGVLAMFSGNVELVSADKKGDFVWNKGTMFEESPEVKSVENRFKPIRFGTNGSWIGTEIQKRVLAVKELKAMSVSIGVKVVKSLAPEINKHLNMTISQFYEEVSKELRKVIASYDRLLVFIENENMLENVYANQAHLFGTDGSGRFQFTLSPNNFTKLV
jgi:hypothetical protein